MRRHVSRFIDCHNRQIAGCLDLTTERQVPAARLSMGPILQPLRSEVGLTTPCKRIVSAQNTLRVSKSRRCEFRIIIDQCTHEALNLHNCIVVSVDDENRCLFPIQYARHLASGRNWNIWL